MGRARVSCASGCSCAAFEIDALHAKRVSQTYLAGFEVTQSSNCVMAVEVLDPGPGRGLLRGHLEVGAQQRPTDGAGDSGGGGGGGSSIGSKFKVSRRKIKVYEIACGWRAC